MSGIIGRSPNVKSGVTGDFRKGEIIQTVNVLNSDSGSNNTSGYVTGQSVSIVPKRLGSKMYIKFVSNLAVTRSDNNEPVSFIAIFQTNNGTILREAQYRPAIKLANIGGYHTCILDFLHAPTYTDFSAIIYGIAGKTTSSATNLYFDDGGPGSVTVQEISQ
jgi:hypothetical protein